MASETEIKDLIQHFNTNHRGKTFAEFIAELFADKYIELYLGDSYEEVSVEQISTAYPAVFCGKVIGAFKECLIINCIYVDKIDKKMRSGHIAFINERAIRGLGEINGNGIMEDMFLRSRESLIIKDKFIDK
ncbi:hypothetical protein UFOVP1290_616 [uncultured Caudovirales phage]|uniref:Uncharacterized protein n=1 Tax=uncultured Caudovirales phage TaxID=2100421 RepID=A0A6J5RSB7_9CAUD|nr:hypothetical protein UFOVP1290_616 [uncultured Caudovirales phage]